MQRLPYSLANHHHPFQSGAELQTSRSWSHCLHHFLAANASSVYWLLVGICHEESYVIVSLITMESYGVVTIDFEGQKTRNVLLIGPF